MGSRLVEEERFDAGVMPSTRIEFLRFSLHYKLQLMLLRGWFHLNYFVVVENMR